MVEKKASGIFYGWWIAVACCLLLTVTSGTGFYSFGVFFKPLMEEFGWGRAATSAAVSIYWLVMGIGSPIAGRLVDTHGPRRVMIGGAIGAGACLVLLSLTNAIWYFYLLYGLTSMAIACASMIPVSSVISRWFKKNRGMAMGVALTGIGIGGLLLVPAAAYVISTLGWRIAYVCLGLVMWLTVPVVWAMVKDAPEPVEASIGRRPEPQLDVHAASPTGIGSRDFVPVRDLNLLAAVRTGAFWLFGLVIVLAAVSTMGVLVHQVPLATDLEISATAAAAALGFTAGIGATGKPAFGYLADKLSIKPTLLLCLALQGVGVLLLLVTRDLPMLWTYVVVFGFSMGGIVTLRPLMAGWLFGLTSFGMVMGAFELIHALGAAVGPMIAGSVYDATGSYQGALVFFGLCYVVAILVVIFIKSPLMHAQLVPAPARSQDTAE
ncbi:MAG: MFS transporter [Chloroflexota bacterium]